MQLHALAGMLQQGPNFSQDTPLVEWEEPNVGCRNVHVSNWSSHAGLTAGGDF